MCASTVSRVTLTFFSIKSECRSRCTDWKNKKKQPTSFRMRTRVLIHWRLLGQNPDSLWWRQIWICSCRFWPDQGGHFFMTKTTTRSSATSRQRLGLNNSDHCFFSVPPPFYRIETRPLLLNIWLAVSCIETSSQAPITDDVKIVWDESSIFGHRSLNWLWLSISILDDHTAGRMPSQSNQFLN